MQEYLKEYWRHLSVLYLNPFLYVFIGLIWMGGHSPIGKVIATVAMIVVVPLFQISYGDLLQKK